MKITVELDDFWMDGEQGLDEALKEHVTQSVIGRIRESIDKKIDQEIATQCRESIEKQLATQIKKYISKFLKKGMIKPQDQSTEVLIEDYIKDKLMSHNGWGDGKDPINAISEALGKELKARYDMLFASQIVIKMGKQGLLKPGVVDTLLEKEKPKSMDDEPPF